MEDLKSLRIKLGFHFMDNEASIELNMTMTSMDIKYKLVPPSNHRSKNVETAIQTFKNNSIAVLCSVDKDFHLQLWEILLQQATISLNFLRQSRTLPRLSAYTNIFGGFDYNHTLLSPPGTQVVIYNRPNNRA